MGGASRAACFSFYATKNLPIGEGGAIATDDTSWPRTPTIPAARHQPRCLAAVPPGGSWRYDVAEPGLKANITDIQAAIGLAQLACLPAWQARRAQLAAQYDAALAGVPGLAPPRGQPQAGMPGTFTRCAYGGIRTSRDPH